MPYFVYEKRSIKEMEYVNHGLPEAQILFNGLDEVSSLNFHTIFTSHGYVKCTSSNRSTALISEEGNAENIIFAVIKPSGAAGEMLVTTLDPDFHATEGCAKEGIVDYNPYARKLYINIVSWAKHKAADQHEVFTWLRWAKGIPKQLFLHYSSLTIIGVLSLISIAFLMGKVTPDLFATVASFASVASFTLALYVEWIKRRE